MIRSEGTTATSAAEREGLSGAVKIFVVFTFVGISFRRCALAIQLIIEIYGEEYISAILLAGAVECIMIMMGP